MWKFIRDKFLSMGRDEEGAALVVTIAVFMFIYLGICGVFAVGKEIKEKIQLQNACDAAAYSAAVVQADTLSRIATLNRAMSWTYSQMTKRQMDYIVCKWLTAVSVKFHQHLTLAEAASSEGCGIHGAAWQSSDADREVCLNEKHILTLAIIDNALSNFAPNYLKDNSFYANPGNLSAQITADATMISQIGATINGLIASLPSKIDASVRNILVANLAEDGKFQYTIDGGYPQSSSWFRLMRNENAFLAFSKSVNEATAWFPLNAANPNGFEHKYTQLGNLLKAEWKWWWHTWVCTEKAHVQTHFPGNSLDPFKEQVLGKDVADSYFYGLSAAPKQLANSYFGPSGTITVGVARYNENPFAKILVNDPATVGGRIVRGLFAAFNPFNEWSWAFSSAKAGYLQLGQEFDNVGAPSRQYKIDWDNNDQTWNLCQSEWDAVLVPVRRAKSTAVNGSWQGNNFNVLAGMVYSGNWKWLGRKAKYQEWANVYAGVQGEVADGSQYIQGWARVKNPPPGYRPIQQEEPSYKTGVIQTQWNVQNRGKSINWQQLTNRMFH